MIEDSLQYLRSHLGESPLRTGNGNPESDSFALSQGILTADFLQHFIDASGSNIAVLDRNRTILFVNRAWRQFAARTGLILAQFGIGGKYPYIGLGTAASCPRDSVAIAKGIDRVIEKKEIEFQIEYQCTALTEPIWFRLHAAAFRFFDQDDNPLILVSHDDITSEKLVGASLVKDRERLTRLLTTTNIIPWESDAKTFLFTYVGEQAVSILGYPAESWLQPSFWNDHIHPLDREKAVAECMRLSQIKDHYQFEYRMIAKDGRVIWINDVVNVHREDGQASTLSGFMMDVTARKQAEDTLRLLGGRLITAQEEERKRIARDLHDDLNQRMALLSIDLEQTGQMLSAESDGVAERVKGLQKKALGISRQIHQMSYTLHPSKLDHLGLVPAIKSFCSEISESRGLSIDFRHEGFPATIPASVTLCVFRVAQEALQNAAKHSGVSTVHVVLKKSDRAVELSISDEGCGFDMDTDKMTIGLGFISMRERLRLVNGEITIQSKPSEGTRISIWVPLDHPFSGLPVQTSIN